MKYLPAALLLLLANIAQADPIRDVERAADMRFAEMPRVMRVDQIAGNCGAGEDVNRMVAYCTTRNQIFVADGVWDTPQAPYLVAHLYSHAVQVRYGIADVALAAIRSRRSEEAMLRGFVARQVDCVAGFLMGQAGQSADLNALFTAEPFTGSHWGRDPLRVGPKVQVGLAARAEWFAIGQTGDLSRCAPGEFTSDLLMQALR